MDMSFEAPTVDDHFRKSLGEKYTAFNRFAEEENFKHRPQVSPMRGNEEVFSVEQHFAKALGNQQSVDDHFAKALGRQTWQGISSKKYSIDGGPLPKGIKYAIEEGPPGLVYLEMEKKR